MTSRPIERLPEDPHRVEAYDRYLKQHGPRLLEEAAALMERYAARGITTIEGCGWPLRPLFLSQKTLDQISRALYEGCEATRQKLLAEGRGALPTALPAPFLDALDLEGCLQSDDFMTVLRPDGFLFEDRYTLIEPNFGNGALISMVYTEIISDFFGKPLQELGWDAEASLHRPFDRLLKMLQQRLPAEPFLAMFCHHYELEIIESWEPRVVHQLHLAQQLLDAAGIANRVVHEGDFACDDQGRTRLLDGTRVDGVLHFTIGTEFLREPQLLGSMLGGPTVGDAPIWSPLATLCIDKGTLPLMAEVWPEQRGFPVEIPWTCYPRLEDAPTYRHHREEYVLKRSFDGKDTYAGVSTPGRVWNRILEFALHSEEYVLQRYQPMPQTIMPMCFDGQHIEWVPVRVELSPFVLQGRYVGAIARYAPEAEGLILSPPPEQMGLTNVFATS